MLFPVWKKCKYSLFIEEHPFQKHSGFLLISNISQKCCPQGFPAAACLGRQQARRGLCIAFGFSQLLYWSAELLVSGLMTAISVQHGSPLKPALWWGDAQWKVRVGEIWICEGAESSVLLVSRHTVQVPVSWWCGVISSQAFSNYSCWSRFFLIRTLNSLLPVLPSWELSRWIRT